MAKVLVLGANGFIGSHLVDSLAVKGHKIRAFDRYGSNQKMFNQADNIEVFPGDFLNEDDLRRSLQDIEYVFHFISTTTPASVENDPTIDIETNIRMSVELFKLCVESGVKRVFFASTGGAIYGESDNNSPHKETDATLPVSPYAIGKLTIENYLRYFKVRHGLESTTFRISNPYGERQPFHRKQGVIPIFLENVILNKPITVLGDGSMVRDYIYVKDVAAMITEVFESEKIQPLYNIGSGEGATLNEIISIAEKVSQRRIERETRAVPATYVKTVVLDTSRFTDDFGVSPNVGLEEGMRRTYEYIKDEMVKAGMK